MSGAGTVTWRELIEGGADRLELAGIDDAATDARRIAQVASGLDAAELVLSLEDPVTARAVASFDAMVDRRSTGEPLQYVLGSWGFRALDLLVDSRALIPRPETEVLVDHALELLDDAPTRERPRCLVDLGTGTGAIGLAVATERPGVDVWATDVSAAALEVARANSAGAGRAATRVRLAEGSWFTALPEELRRRIDVVVSNPPYIGANETLPSDVDGWEPATALRAGPEGTEALLAIVGSAPEWIAPGGGLALELAPHQAEQLTVFASEAGLVDVRVSADLAGRPRVLTGRIRQ